ncbi:MAG: hypothetical protein KW804_03410, partial [Candidatus Doudnabacteria bacterium]|nr:hypothetical protein [Candidatus Doudnabacteria bacterium]
GAFTAYFFGESQAAIWGNLLFGLIGSIGFGYLSKGFVPETRGRDLNQQSFSPGALLWALMGAIIVLVVFNILI